MVLRAMGHRFFLPLKELKESVALTFVDFYSVV